VTTQKGDQLAVVYYNKMKGFADEMVVAGKPLEHDDFISYVLAGLDQEYNLFVENVTSKTEISLGALYSQLLATKARLELQQSQFQSSHYVRNKNWRQRSETCTKVNVSDLEK
jgi:hypothetical protein